MSFYWVRVSSLGIEEHTVVTVGDHAASDERLTAAIADADPMTACWRTVDRLRSVGHVDMFSPFRGASIQKEAA